MLHDTWMRASLPPPECWQRRFWSKVTVVNDADSCWPCSATPNIRYAQFRFGKDIYYGHELAVVLDGRELGENVDHLCRNTHCVRPSHLEVVSFAENISRGWDLRREKGFCTTSPSMGTYVVIDRGEPTVRYALTSAAAPGGC